MNPDLKSMSYCILKFRFCKKATKIWRQLSKFQIKWGRFCHICEAFLRKSELYKRWFWITPHFTGWKSDMPQTHGTTVWLLLLRVNVVSISRYQFLTLFWRIEASTICWVWDSWSRENAAAWATVAPSSVKFWHPTLAFSRGPDW